MFERNAKNGSWGEFDGFTPKKKNCDICLTRNKRACSLQSNVPPLTAVCPLPWEPLESLYTTGPPHHGKRPAKIFTEKITEKGGYPTPPSRKAASQKVNGKKNHGKGGYPPPITDIFRNRGF